jgi:hypothetical protein
MEVTSLDTRRRSSQDRSARSSRRFTGGSSEQRTLDQLVSIRLKLGDEAEAWSRFPFPNGYYDVAEAEAKRLAPTTKLEQSAMKKVQPVIDVFKAASNLSDPITSAAQKPSDKENPRSGSDSRFSAARAWSRRVRQETDAC